MEVYCAGTNWSSRLGTTGRFRNVTFYVLGPKVRPLSSRLSSILLISTKRRESLYREIENRASILDLIVKPAVHGAGNVPICYHKSFVLTILTLVSGRKERSGWSRGSLPGWSMAVKWSVA